MVYLSNSKFSIPNSQFSKFMSQDNLIKFKCTVCNEINYYTFKNKKKIQAKLELKKHCPKCRKHTPHIEMKKK
jgi:large subunit ribosomal protein L33